MLKTLLSIYLLFSPIIQFGQKMETKWIKKRRLLKFPLSQLLLSSIHQVHPGSHSTESQLSWLYTGSKGKRSLQSQHLSSWDRREDVSSRPAPVTCLSRMNHKSPSQTTKNKLPKHSGILKSESHHEELHGSQAKATKYREPEKASIIYNWRDKNNPKTMELKKKLRNIDSLCHV